jgi:hypothetical protein
MEPGFPSFIRKLAAGLHRELSFQVNNRKNLGLELDHLTITTNCYPRSWVFPEVRRIDRYLNEGKWKLQRP